MKHIITNILYFITVITTMTGCSDTLNSLFGDEIEVGDQIMFTTMVPDTKQPLRTAKEEWENRVKAYKAVQQEYTFNIEMWRRRESTTKVGQSTYKPISENIEGVLTYSVDGTLQNVESPLYWQDNVSKWGFRATAGTETLETEQTDQKKWLAQDRLLGYSYLPLWTGADDDGRAIDDFNTINYRTSREWYADNKEAQELSGLMPESNDDYKKIPLFLQHQRSWITVILKAGEGVTREALAYATSAENIQTTIYSYKNGEQTAINAWPNEELINYDADKNGDAASNISSTRYDAIVEPHNFIESRESEEHDIIASINVSNQKFTFAAANDFNYAQYIADGGSEIAKQAMQAYNLLPGKHLTITATLSRASRMIMITAWIEDWTETVTQTICDDYGQNGDPILIENREQLVEFLTAPDMNKAGNVGLIVPNALSLTGADEKGKNWDGNDYTLRATLNLAGCKLSIDKQFINSIARTGRIINGEVNVTDAFHAPTAIANTNYGTIERVRITSSGELTPAKASVAGLIDTNYGTIYQCSSALPVYGTTANYVGGIAARSLFNSGDNVSPVIDACTVTARVDGNDNVTAGGGIVGQAEGRVSYNTFEYGVTLLQKEKFYNIIAAIGENNQGLTNHTNNSWPTTERYTVRNTSTEIFNSNAADRFDAIIDCRDELKEVLKSGNNQSTKTYRLANSFPVDKENWIWGNDVLNDEYFATNAIAGNYNHGMVRFKLNGNNKTITLTGNTYATMLFGSIIGEIEDLNISLAKPLVAPRIMSQTNSADDSNTDAIAAFAYAVTGTGSVAGSIRNINLKANDGTYIESTTPGGIAVWASHGGKITACASNAPIRMALSSGAGSDARHYAGGIVAVAQRANITQCRYYAVHGISWAGDDSESNKARKNNCRYGGIVGGTSEIANSEEVSSLQLSDCYSWWELPTFDESITADNRPRMGSLIGSTVYHTDQIIYNAMADGNAGNWWAGTIGASFMKDGITEEKAIGRKNAVMPTKPSGW